MFLIPIYMACLSRAAGGWLNIPGENFLYALPYALPFLMFDICPVWVPIIAVICAGIGKGQANREYMDLGTWTGPERKPHNYSFLFNWLHLPPYWHDFLGLTLVGLAPALIPSIMAGYFDPIHGLILALGGMSKAPAYAIGHLMPKYQTEMGEALTGFGAGISIILVI